MGLSDAIIRVGQLNCSDVNVTIPTARSYVQDGLVAMWDVGFNPPTTTSWEPVVGNNAEFTLTNTTIDSDGGLQFAGTSNSYGQLSQQQSSIFPTTQGTIQIIFKLLSIPSSNGGRGGCILKTPTDSKIGLGLFGKSNQCYITGSNNQSGNAVIYRSNTTWAEYVNDMFSVSIEYSPYISYYLNGISINAYGTDSIGGSQNVTRIGSRTSNTYPFHGNIYSIRVYSSILTDNDILLNHAIDRIRFNLP